MTRPASTREALIAEALGDLGQLLDRVEALAPAMDEARRSLIQASADLARQAETFVNALRKLLGATPTQPLRRESLAHAPTQKQPRTLARHLPRGAAVATETKQVLNASSMHDIG